jgi:fructose-1,6-bisphosphatase/inositol monophosphatase family enzyme
LLSEEMDTTEQQRLISDPSRALWVLDPLDGTSNFAAGLPVFSVSLALLSQGEVVLGLVCDMPYSSQRSLGSVKSVATECTDSRHTHKTHPAATPGTGSLPGAAMSTCTANRSCGTMPPDS